MSDLYDVCVIGGGPAGATLALRLAQLGRKVAIVEKAAFPRTHVGETLSAGVIDLLDTIGLREAVEESSCFVAARATISWAGDVFERDSGYRVDRACFDTILLAAAADAGVVIYQPDLIANSNFAEGKWHLLLRSGNSLRACYLADAGGRSNRGALTTRAKKLPIGVPTFAMYAYWYGVDSGDSKILTEAGSNHWYWGTFVPDGPFIACAFVDRIAVRESGRYYALMAESLLISPRLGGSRCRLAGEVRICDATPYMDDTPVTERWIRLGDAVLSLDPLSSQGTQVAMSTALRAASVVLTILNRPEDAELAMTFYRDRIADLARYHRAVTVASYRRHFEAVGASAFWRCRSEGGDLPSFESTVTNFMSRPEGRFHVSTDVSFVKVGAIEGDYIVEVEAIEIAGRISAYFNGSSIASMLHTLDGTAMSAQELVAYWSRAIPLPIAIRFFQWSCKEGILVSSV